MAHHRFDLAPVLKKDHHPQTVGAIGDGRRIPISQCAIMNRLVAARDHEPTIIGAVVEAEIDLGGLEPADFRVADDCHDAL